ncbi:Vegetative incompatibility protein HET-E-1 [Cladobotryum mycophilum]|uniref:Vegetative incompatibility protein HET-E-1 n=1 Tax=Cladobotryum mycophilum TaxID=491253 RepID=A0ABR0SRG4_9HYPO
MRLINVHNYQLELFNDSSIPPYAILSHTWGKNEVTYLQLQPSSRRNGPDKRSIESSKDTTYRKVIFTCKQAIRDGLDYAWIDTCCINKSSSAELSEAINSMFHWYHQARVCYAYLSDVSDIKNPEANKSEFRTSKWFTRGWTLQELLAPSELRFYSRDWKLISPITSLYETIKDITGIETVYLTKDSHSTFMFRHASVATRMSWAAKRKTTRVEDMAYCLFGIFDGEGEYYNTPFEHGYLAASPANFLGCRNLVPWPSVDQGTAFSITNRGLQVTVPIRQVNGNNYNAILRCSRDTEDNEAIALPLVKLENSGDSWNDISCYSRTDRAPHNIAAEGYSEWPTTIRIANRPWWPSTVLSRSGKQLVYFRKLPVGCSIVNVSHVGELLPRSNIISIGADDISQPRFIHVWSSSRGGLMIRLQWRGNGMGWDCGIAAMKLKKNTKITGRRATQQLSQIPFKNSIRIDGCLFDIRLLKEKVFGRELMVIDLTEKQLRAFVWANALSEKFAMGERVEQALIWAGALSNLLYTASDDVAIVGLVGFLGVLSIGGYGNMGPIVAS